MIVMGIDTSCDDTAVAAIRDGELILSNVVSSQDSFHAPFGGVVPEVASRRHLEVISSVFQSALEQAGLNLGDLNAVGVTYGPGLLGSLLVGLSFARAIAWSLDIPLVPVNHHCAHFYGAFLRDSDPKKGECAENLSRFPFVGLLVSGGHTMLAAFNDHFSCRLLGATRDDACGEVFDKVARLLDLGYPGGPLIERAAQTGSEETIKFPRPMLRKGLDFSFSGLKTAVARYVLEQKSAGNSLSVSDVAAGLQQAVVDVLITKTLAAVEKTGFNTVVVSGGVAANEKLRSAMNSAAVARGIEVWFPDKRLCTDNGAMVAALAATLLKNNRGPSSAFEIDAKPGASLADFAY